MRGFVKLAPSLSIPVNIAQSRVRPAGAILRFGVQTLRLSPKAVLETSLYVSDIDRALAFYQDVLGLRKIDEGYFAGGRGAALQVGSGPSVLLLFRADITRRGGELPAHGATGAGHAAFRVEPGELPAWRRRLREKGVAIEKEFAFGDHPPSVYFRDPDGNSLELAVSSIWRLKPLKIGSAIRP
jgi:catechol 2,3-dioxygenase-like lactoylglutathione lyase family enzyme